MKKLLDVCTLAVAILALGLSTCSFVRENERADRILTREEFQARQEIKPVLRIVERRYDAGYGIRLTNNGIGPAFIKKAEFSANGIVTNHLIELFPDFKSNDWIDYTSVPNDVILPTGSFWDLAKLSNPELKVPYLATERGIRYSIDYADIYGNLFNVSGTLSGN